MLKNNDAFIMKPIFGDLKSQGLKLKDIIVYITIRFLCNIENDGYTPALTDIQSISGCSSKAITKSIKRLQRAKYLEFDRDALENGYTFNNKLNFQKVSTDILCEDELTRKEKAILLILHEYNEDGCPGVGIDIAEQSGLYLKGFRKHCRSLINKRYIFEEQMYLFNETELLIFISTYGVDLVSEEVYSGSELDIVAMGAK